MPHVLGNAGGPPGPTRNEAKLQAEIEQLRAELDAARLCQEVLRRLFAALEKITGEVSE